MKRLITLLACAVMMQEVVGDAFVVYKEGYQRIGFGRNNVTLEGSLGNEYRDRGDYIYPYDVHEVIILDNSRLGSINILHNFRSLTNIVFLGDGHKKEGTHITLPVGWVEKEDEKDFVTILYSGEKPYKYRCHFTPPNHEPPCKNSAGYEVLIREVRINSFLEIFYYKNTGEHFMLRFGKLQTSKNLESWCDVDFIGNRIIVLDGVGKRFFRIKPEPQPSNIPSIINE